MRTAFDICTQILSNLSLKLLHKKKSVLLLLIANWRHRKTILKKSIWGIVKSWQGYTRQIIREEELNWDEDDGVSEVIIVSGIGFGFRGANRFCRRKLYYHRPLQRETAERFCWNFLPFKKKSCLETPYPVLPLYQNNFLTTCKRTDQDGLHTFPWATYFYDMRRPKSNYFLGHIKRMGWQERLALARIFATLAGLKFLLFNFCAAQSL